MRNVLTSTGNGAVIPPRWASGAVVPTDIDDERCILFCTRLTVNITGDLSKSRNQINQFYFHSH